VLRILGLIVSIAFADSLNPTTIGPASYLAAGKHPIRAVLGFTAGTWGVMFLGGIVLTVGPGGVILALVPTPGPTSRYVLETVAGVVMLVLGGFLWRRRGPRVDGERRVPSSRLLRRARSPVVLGATIEALELPTSFPYFAAIAAIVGSGLDFGERILAVAIYDVVFVLPLLAIAGTLRIAGPEGVRLLARARTWFAAHWRMVAAIAAIAVGLFVLALGITGLTESVHGVAGELAKKIRHLISHGSLFPKRHRP
jgi:cytochrome c biogenesis protein CcdA